MLNTSTEQGSNFITRQRWIRRRIHRIFSQLDIDGSGSLDSAELYSGVLLIHLELAKYFGPAACKPPSRSQVTSLFHQYDTDRSSTLSRPEFTSLCVLLLSNIAGRVAFQLLVTIALLPALAPLVVKHLAMILSRAGEAGPVLALATQARDLYDAYVLSGTAAEHVVSRAAALVPKNLPDTVVSVCVVTMVVPGVLDYIDQVSVGAARRKKKGA